MPGTGADRAAAAATTSARACGTPTTPPPSPTPTDDCPPPVGPELTEAERTVFGKAGRDRVITRDRSTVDCHRRVVLTAIGDSVTSAHVQEGFGQMCQGRTRQDDVRGLVGNDGRSSYAGLVARDVGRIVSYYNVARTGFDTSNMLMANRATPDACDQPWNLDDAPPAAVAASIVRSAKRAGDTAYVAGTAGANDTNWAKIISAVLQCRALKWIYPTVKDVARFTWEGEAEAIPNGGSCELASTIANEPISILVPIPRYNGAVALPQIRDNVRRMSETFVRAGADKVVWMAYHDITPAQIDLGEVVWGALRPQMSRRAQELLADQLRFPVPLVEERFRLLVQRMVADVNQAVGAGIPAGGRVVQARSVVTQADIQITAIGGSPHPNDAGHLKLGTELRRMLGI